MPSPLEELRQEQNNGLLIGKEFPTSSAPLSPLDELRQESVSITPLQPIISAPSALDELRQGTAQQQVLNTTDIPLPNTDESIQRLQLEREFPDAPESMLDKAISLGGGVLSNAIDLLSRANYAAAGGLEALGSAGADPKESVVHRVGRELFSGVGNLVGDKHGFAQAMERMGVGELGSISQIPGIELLFSDDPAKAEKEWFTWLKHGPLDITGRGVIGFGGDVLLDPLTYTSFGADKLAKIGLKFGKAEMPAASRWLNKTGIEEVRKGIQKELGLTDAGIQQYRRELFGQLPNGGSWVDPFKMSPEVRQSIFKTTSDGIIHIADFSKVDLTNLSSTQWGKMTKAAEQAVHDKIASQWLTDPKSVAHLFDDGGIKFMGKVIPGTDKLQQLMSGFTADKMDALYKNLLKGANEGSALKQWALDSGRFMNGTFNAVRSAFVRDKSKNEFWNQGTQHIRDEADSIRNVYAKEFDTAIGKTDFTPQEWKVFRNLYNDIVYEKDALKAADKITIASGGNTKLEEKLTDAYDTVKRALDAFDEKEFELLREQMAKNGVPESVINGVDEAVAGLETKSIRTVAALDRSTEAVIEKIAPKLTGDAKTALEQYFNQRIIRTHFTNLPVFFDNKGEEIDAALRILDSHFGTNLSLKSFGRHRALFSSMPADEIVSAMRRLQQIDPSMPTLKPITDIREIMRRRTDIYADAFTGRKLEDLLSQFDIGKLPFAVQDVFRDVNSQIKLSPAEQEKFDKTWFDWLKRKSKPFGSVNEAGEEVGLAGPHLLEPKGTDYSRSYFTKKILEGTEHSKEFKQAWIQREMAGISTRKDMQDFMGRYGDYIAQHPDVIPRFKFRNIDQYTQFSSQPTRVVGNKYEVPLDIYNDYTSMSKQLMLSDSTSRILRAFDTANNLFKMSVTGLGAHPSVTLGAVGAAGGAAQAPEGERLKGAALGAAAGVGVGAGLRAAGVKSLPAFVGFHFRNAYTNLAQAFTDVGISSLSPRLYGKTLELRSLIKAIEREEVSLEQATKLGAFALHNGAVRPMLSLAHDAKELGILAEGRSLFEFTGAAGAPESATAKLFGKAYRTVVNSQTDARQVGIEVENFFRLQTWLNYIRRGMTPEDAAAAMKRVLFDYSNLSGVEQAFFKRIFPFYVWTSKNVKLQMEFLRTKPGRVAAQMKLVRGQNEENDRIAQYDVDGSRIRMNRRGDIVTVIDGVDLPFRGLKYLDTLLTLPALMPGVPAEFPARRWAEVVGMLNPMIKMPLIDSWTKGQVDLNPESPRAGEQVQRRYNSTLGIILERAPEELQTWLGYNKETNKNTGKDMYSFNAKKFGFLVQMTLMSRVLSLTDKAFQRDLETNDKSVIQATLDSFYGYLSPAGLTGLRDAKFDLNDEDTKKLRQRIKMMEQQLVDSGKRKGYTRTFVPRGQ